MGETDYFIGLRGVQKHCTRASLHSDTVEDLIRISGGGGGGGGVVEKHCTGASLHSQPPPPPRNTESCIKVYFSLS